MESVERKENHKRFWQRVKAVAAFPFKVLWLLAKVTGVLLLGGVLTTVGYCVYRSGQPMVVPEARGMTYREFYKDRYENWKALDERKTIAGQDESGHACVLSGVAYVSLFAVPVLAFEATVSVIYPDSKFAQVQEAGDSYFHRNVPVGSKPIWHNFLPLFWEAVERKSWTWFVIRGSFSKACPMPPVKILDSASP